MYFSAHSFLHVSSHTITIHTSSCTQWKKLQQCISHELLCSIGLASLFCVFCRFFGIGLDLGFKSNQESLPCVGYFLLQEYSDSNRRIMLSSFNWANNDCCVEDWFFSGNVVGSMDGSCSRVQKKPKIISVHDIERFVHQESSPCAKYVIFEQYSNANGCVSYSCL